MYVTFDVYYRVNATDVAEYFPYPRVINFLFEFCEALFGISVKVSGCVLYFCLFVPSVKQQLFVEVVLNADAD